VGLARDVTYRDRAIQCSRCGTELVRNTAHDTWQCRKCNAVLTGIGELAHALMMVAPHLAGDGHVRDVPMIGRRTAAPPLACPACGDGMEPVFLGGVELDRCTRDELVWFDGGELELVLDVAREQDRADDRSWLRRVLDVWLA